ncbi:hypothetical protein C4571_00685 [Candidatus Parcubacteria bacterium]|nr:MAG: hypothetical protein C4571_00685 [Candidatus Parcubacteria bacterium]
MRKLREFVGETGMMVATTVGAGMFALPYVFSRSGWVVGLFYLFAVSVVIVLIHRLYWEVLDQRKGSERLVGLAERYFGKIGLEAAFFIIIGGLLLALVVYLILGSQFLSLIFPSLGWSEALIVFWLVCSLPLLFGLERIVRMEIFGSLVIIGIIFWVFFSASPPEEVVSFGKSAKDLLTSFGPVLFALAGWTAVEPIYDFHRSRQNGETHKSARGLAVGTFLSALLYSLFIFGIFGSSGVITPDSISGLDGWSAWAVTLLALLGLFAIWTSYVPIGLEIRNALEVDLAWSKFGVASLIFLGPLLLVLFGLNDFVQTLGLAGGIFLGLQHLLIIALGMKALPLSWPRKILFGAFSGFFILAAFYEIYYFVVG